jgi:hypothetical protein
LPRFWNTSNGVGCLVCELGHALDSTVPAITPLNFQTNDLTNLKEQNREEYKSRHTSPHDKHFSPAALYLYHVEVIDMRGSWYCSSYNMGGVVVSWSVGPGHDVSQLQQG